MSELSPLSAPVLWGAALVSSPALWGAFVDGTTTAQTALTRYLVCAVLCWLGLAVVSMLVGPAPRSLGTGVESTDGSDRTMAQEADAA